mmetsp:Transcript_29635/g.45797  ORF Transcript_29635/g.45797 Transcript_29635/m.45797 type:complete len:515 (-) Transcript_29635:296-1840(-)
MNFCFLFLFFSFFLLLPHVSSSSCPCQFAGSFSISNLTTEEEQQRLMGCVVEWESNFGNIGYNHNNGMTFDGHELDYTTGELAPPLHYWSAASKESLHLYMAALALNNNTLAQQFFSPSDPTQGSSVVLSILSQKLDTIDNFSAKYPGFSGFLPWFYHQEEGGIIPADGWDNQVPGLDNGEMIWGWYAVQVALEKMVNSSLEAGRAGEREKERKREESQHLLFRIEKYLELMKKTVNMVFYNKNGYMRSVSLIHNTSLPPLSSSHYELSCPSGVQCYLDDPYEGEMLVVFSDLYGEWEKEEEREVLWARKRKKLQKTEYIVPPSFPVNHNNNNNITITVQKGWWFSSHEQWKYLALPYLSASSTNKRVFLNGERARAINSVVNSLGALHASVTDVCSFQACGVDGETPPGYISNTGIPSISFNPDQNNAVVTPYGSFPLLLADPPTGLAWYLSSLQAIDMQNPYGSTESINISATGKTLFSFLVVSNFLSFSCISPCHLGLENNNISGYVGRCK